ncbi:hypothetical protein GQ457_17G013110 [Hibiscus cannabinus]
MNGMVVRNGELVFFQGLQSSYLILALLIWAIMAPYLPGEEGIYHNDSIGGLCNNAWNVQLAARNKIIEHVGFVNVTDDGRYLGAILLHSRVTNVTYMYLIDNI